MDADSWNNLFNDRCESRNYSRLPQSPRRNETLLDLMKTAPAEYNRLQIHTHADDEKQQPRRHSLNDSHYNHMQKTLSLADDEQPRRSFTKVGSLAKRLSKVGVVDEPSPRIKKQPGVIHTRKNRVETLVANPNSCWRFVERSWFQAVSAVVIISNVVTTIVEMDKPQTEKMFFISDQVMLVFYVMELFSRASYLGNVFLFGPCDLVCWNVLDIVVVGSGVVDQWLMPILPIGKDSGLFSKVLTLLRLLRLLRVFKIVRVFLDIDLSWTEAPAFQSFIGVVIMINSVLMGVEIDVKWHGWFYIEQVLLCIYVFELSVRLKYFGCNFFSCSSGDIVWNVLDFVIVVSSVLDSWITPLCGVILKSIAGEDAESHKKAHGISLGKIMMLMRMLRLMRILRLAKLIKSIQPLFILVTGVMAALQGVIWVLVLTIVTLYAMGILATSLIGKKMGFPPGSDVPDKILKPFSTVPNSMFTLFRVMSGAASDAESGAIDLLMDNVPALKLCFVFFMITSSWTLLSILTAVVSDNMISTTGQQEEEIKIATAEEDRAEHVEKLTELFNTIDVGGDGQVERDEIEQFLQVKENAILTARRCRVPVRDVREVLQTVAEACEGSTVSIETFVEHLADVSNVVTQKSVMKIEALLANISKQIDESFVKLHGVLGSSPSRGNMKNDSELDKASRASSKASQTEVARPSSKDQLQDVERFMQGFIERTEASLNESYTRNQRLFQSMTEVHESFASSQVKVKSKYDSEMGRSAEVSPKASPRESQTAGKGQLQDAERVVQGFIERTEASLNENYARNQRLFESMTGALERSLSKKFSDLLESQFGRSQEPGISDLRDAEGSTALTTLNLTSDQESPSVQKPLIIEQPTSPREAIKRGSRDQPSTIVQIEARLLAIQEYMQGSQQKIESILRRIEAPLQRMSTARNEWFAAYAVDNFSTSLEPGLRPPMQQSSVTSKAKDTTEWDNQLACVEETQKDVTGMLRASRVHRELFATPAAERLLATEQSILSLQQKAEAVFRQIECLVEKAMDTEPSECALDKFSETLERELRMMRQELLCSVAVSRVKDGLPVSPGRAAKDALPLSPVAAAE